MLMRWKLRFNSWWWPDALIRASWVVMFESPSGESKVWPPSISFPILKYSGLCDELDCGDNRCYLQCTGRLYFFHRPLSGACGSFDFRGRKTNWNRERYCTGMSEGEHKDWLTRYMRTYSMKSIEDKLMAWISTRKCGVHMLPSMHSSDPRSHEALPMEIKFARFGELPNVLHHSHRDTIGPFGWDCILLSASQHADWVLSMRCRLLKIGQQFVLHWCQISIDFAKRLTFYLLP